MINSVAERDLTIEDIFRIFKKRFKWFLLTLVVVLTLSFISFHRAVPVYETKTTIEIEPIYRKGIADLFLNQNLLSSYSDYLNTYISSQIALIKSRKSVEEVVKRLNLVDKLKKSNPNINLNRAVDIVSSWISVSPVMGTKKISNMIAITVKNSDPKLAADVANELVKVYIYLLKEKYTSTRKLIESKIPQVEEALRRAKDKIRKFKEEYGFFTLDEKAERLLQLLSEYDDKLNQVNIQIEETKTNIKTLNELLSKESEKIITSETITYNPVVIDLKQRLSDLYIQLSALELQYSENSLKVISIKNQIAKIKELLKKETEKIITSQTKSINPIYSDIVSQLVTEQTQLQMLKASKDSIEKIREEYRKEVSKLPLLEQQFIELESSLKNTGNWHALLVEKLNEVKYAEMSVTNDIRIIDYAEVPTTPIKPNKKLVIAFSGALGIFLGILIVYMVEAIDNKIRDEADVKRIIMDVPIIGRIPKYKRRGYESEIVTMSHPISLISESVKLLGVNTMFCIEGKSKVICVTSPGPYEGKTFIAANLSTVLSQNGYKTLILDLDMRKPHIEKVFGIEEIKVGITSHIFEDVSLDKITVEVEENLHIIPVGIIPPNPTVVLTSSRLKEALGILKQKYDIVIIDLPSILATADALIAGKNVDGMIIVTRINVTQKSLLKLAYENLKAAGVNIIGTVINGVTKHDFFHYYRYYSKNKSIHHITPPEKV